MMGVRFRADVGFEGKCHYCNEWWPLDAEFWNPRWSLKRCRACVKEYRREYQNAKYRVDPAFREVRLESARLTAWKDRVNRPALVSERKRLYYRRNREHILARQRARYWALRAAS